MIEAKNMRVQYSDQTLRNIVTRLTALVSIITFVVLLGGSYQSTSATELSDQQLVTKLREGGYNIYFRHAPTDWSLNDKVRKTGDWTSCDPDKMRQLSDAGRTLARRIGKAINALQIPVGEVLSSEYCRVVETARLMEIGEVNPTRKIMNMRSAEYVGGRQAVIRRARRVLSDTPPAGTNRVIVAHGNLMRAATGNYASEGGCGIYVPDRQSEKGFKLLARLSPDDWFRLADQFSQNNPPSNQQSK